MKHEWILMKCPTCGHENNDGSIFCNKCEVFLQDLHLPIDDQISSKNNEDYKLSKCKEGI